MFKFINNRVTCVTCQSTNVAKRYLVDNCGEVEGVERTCLDCDAQESF